MKRLWPCLGIALAVLASSAAAQELRLPADAPKHRNFNQQVEARPGTTCNTENNRCLEFCNRNPSNSGCFIDCKERIDYCRKSGFYLWLNAPSVKVETKN